MKLFTSNSIQSFSLIQVSKYNKLALNIFSRCDQYTLYLGNIIFYCLQVEALAEHLHVKVRKEHWGYDNNEDLDIADLHSVKYQVHTRYISGTYQVHTSRRLFVNDRSHTSVKFTI